MSQFIVKGKNKLEGTIKVSGAKNAALPVIMASLLGRGASVLCDIPDLKDVNNIIKILTALGAETEYKDNKLWVDTSQVDKLTVPPQLAEKLRASYYALGALLGRYGKAVTTLPGGCEIGNRPIDLHLKGFKALGAEVKQTQELVEVKADKLTGAEIYLDYPSVGATMNLMMAAVMAEGETRIENPAKEPEIVDLANYLSVMGAKIKGAGTDMITIQGVDELAGREYTIIPDRIETGTYILGAVVTNSNLYVDNVLVEHVNSLLAKLREMGVKFKEDVTGVEVVPTENLQAVNVKTLPYPGFPTDLQPQFITLLTQAAEEGKVVETVFEDRFSHVEELKKMGAEIEVTDNQAVVKQSQLQGAEVTAHDLRAGASLILAGLAAEGKTVISDIYHVKRGYEDITDKLSRIGADIKEIE